MDFWTKVFFSLNSSVSFCVQLDENVEQRLSDGQINLNVRRLTFIGGARYHRMNVVITRVSSDNFLLCYQTPYFNQDLRTYHFSFVLPQTLIYIGKAPIVLSLWYKQESFWKQSLLFYVKQIQRPFNLDCLYVYSNPTLYSKENVIKSVENFYDTLKDLFVKLKGFFYGQDHSRGNLQGIVKEEEIEVDQLVIVFRNQQSERFYKVFSKEGSIPINLGIGLKESTNSFINNEIVEALVPLNNHLYKGIYVSFTYIGDLKIQKVYLGVDRCSMKDLPLKKISITSPTGITYFWQNKKIEKNEELTNRNLLNFESIWKRILDQVIVVFENNGESFYRVYHTSSAHPLDLNQIPGYRDILPSSLNEGVIVKILGHNPFSEKLIEAEYISFPIEKQRQLIVNLKSKDLLLKDFPEFLSTVNFHSKDDNSYFGTNMILK